MKHAFTVLLVGLLYLNGFSQTFAAYDSKSITYDSLISAYTVLNNQYSTCDLIPFGETDSGKPLHLFLVNKSGEFYPEAFRNKTIILVQNGIHAGEPCGIDASLQWVTHMLESNQIPDSVVIGIIPVLNIGGMLNRRCCTRANQNGPEEQGFRGNARNLDLNRDYVKMDSRNIESFARIFHWLQPHLFVDTHTSNGADYQHTMTLLTTRKERLAEPLSAFLTTQLEPYLYDHMDDLIPYVNVFGTSPTEGINGFNDSPRYATGYVSMFNCIGFTTEAHMLKPFADRVEQTKKFLEVLTEYAQENSGQIIRNKALADVSRAKATEFLNLQLDTTQYTLIPFLSYKPYYAYSDILGREQLFYDKSSPEKVMVKYYNSYDGIDSVRVPKFYLVDGAWKEVIQRLKSNNIQLIPIESDTVISGEGTYITDVKNAPRPYEGHFLHRDMETKDTLMSFSASEGDYLVPMNQKGWKYILHVLEAKSEDSFFAWNFYDEILQQKEWYSSYVFEPYAKKMLEENKDLNKEYNRLLSTNKEFATNGDQRLYWLYQKSPFYESEHNKLPILKIFD